MSNCRRLVIIANPKAGRGRAARALERLIRKWPYPPWIPELRCTSGPGDARRIASSLSDHPPDLLAVCGGDGTLQEIATAIPDAPFPVGLLPAGTGNVLAHELGLPLNPRRALECILMAPATRIDLGESLRTPFDRFVLMAGIGLDARVVSSVAARSKYILGRVAFALEAIRTLADYPFTPFRAHSGAEEIECVSCIVANSRGYGGNLKLMPDANMCDGLLDVLAIEKCSRLALGWFIVGALWGHPRPYPFIRRWRTERLKVEGPPEIPIQMDGELRSGLPIDIAIRHRCFSLVDPWRRL